MEICLLMSMGVPVNKGTCCYRKWWHARDEVGAPSHPLCSTVDTGLPRCRPTTNLQSHPRMGIFKF